MLSLGREVNYEEEKVIRETQIQVQLSGIEQQIREVEKHSLSLLKKLAPILVPSPQKGEGAKPVPTLNAPLANQLRIFKERLEAIVTGIKDASSRCEL